MSVQRRAPTTKPPDASMTRNGMNTACIGVGSNQPFLGWDTSAIVMMAMEAVGKLGETVCTSSLYQSAAWPDPSDPPYKNAVLALRTNLTPLALLQALQGIEGGFGRYRDYAQGAGKRYQSRTLDLDILTYADRVCSAEDGVVIPHPAMGQRDFVLLPLMEIASDGVVPGSSMTITPLWQELIVSKIPRTAMRLA